MAKLSGITTPSLTFDEGAAPSTPAANDVILYAKSDGLLYSKDDAGAETVVSGGGSTFRRTVVYRTSTQSINNTTWTAVQFDNELTDADALHDNATNNHRLTIPAAWNGRIVVIGANGEWAGNVTGQRGMRLLNGATRIGEVFSDTVTDVALPLRQIVTSAPLSVATSDILTVEVWQDSGGALDIQGTNNSTFRFWAYTVD